MNNINSVNGPGKQSFNIEQTSKNKAAPSQSFKDTLSSFVSDVNSMQNEAGDSIERLVSGQTSDVHGVMNTVQEAKTAFNMMMEIRGKVLDAYDEIKRMRL
ncbi:MAG: flagellar hook-basal body complex protein FliE [Fibrobacterota bacterium]